MSVKNERALEDASLFNVSAYVMPCPGCDFTIKLPNQDLCFLETLKFYAIIDKYISKAGLGNFSQPHGIYVKTWSYDHYLTMDSLSYF